VSQVGLLCRHRSEVDGTTLQVYDQHEHLIKKVPRTSRKEIRRHKAYGHTTNHKTG
jgi:hypothetical protein